MVGNTPPMTEREWIQGALSSRGIAEPLLTELTGLLAGFVIACKSPAEQGRDLARINASTEMKMRMEVDALLEAERATTARLTEERDAIAEELASNRACNLYTWKQQAETAQAQLATAQAERDKLQAAYDLVQSGHGWCRCHDAILQVGQERDHAQATVGALRDELQRATNQLCGMCLPDDHTGDCEARNQALTDSEALATSYTQALTRPLEAEIARLREWILCPHHHPMGDGQPCGHTKDLL